MLFFFNIIVMIRLIFYRFSETFLVRNSSTKITLIVQLLALRYAPNLEIVRYKINKIFTKIKIISVFYKLARAFYSSIFNVNFINRRNNIPFG